MEVTKIRRSREMTNNSTPSSGHFNASGDVDGYSQWFILTITVTLSVSAILGFIGNALVVAVIFRAKKLRSVMNRFVLHLAISDLIVCSLCIPLFLTVNFNFVKNTSINGTAKMVSCKLARFLQYLAPEASMTILITIGFNRHRAVVHPLNMMTYSTANRLITAAWVYAIVVVTPSLYLTEVKPVTVNSSVLYCATIPATTLLGLIYVMFLGTFGYLIPLAGLIILYGKICKTVWLRQKNNLGQTIPAKAYIQSRKKVLKMFLTVILIFIITWLPLLIYIVAIRSPSRIDHARLIVYAIGLCNSVCNPFIYALFNPKFRAGCKDLCTSCRLFRFLTPQSANRKPVPRGANHGPAVNGRPSANSSDTNGSGANALQRELNRRGGFRATDSNSEKEKSTSKNTRSKAKKTSSPKARNEHTIGGLKPFYLCFKRQGFAVNQDEEHDSNTTLSEIELTMFQRTELADGVGMPQKQDEQKGRVPDTSSLADKAEG